MARDKESKNKLTVADRALGGKMRCPGCGGEWWVSSTQAKYADDNDSWPTSCGNEYCDHEGELTFIPYDVEENLRIFKERNDPAASTLKDMVKMLIEREKGGNA